MLKLNSGRSSKSLKAEGKSDDDDEDDANDFNEDEMSFNKARGKNTTMESESDGDSGRTRDDFGDEGYYKKGSGGLSN